MMAKKKEFEALLALFDGAAGGICVTDREGTILYLNRAAEKMAEAEKAGVGRKETDLFGAPSVFEMCSGRNEAVTFPKDKNNGHSFLVLSYPLETQDGKGLIVSFLREKEETAEKDDENTLLIYKGNSMSQVFRLATKFAKMDSTVLISGESGTGKVMLA
ncbi:MAG: PAS domain-containing protein, partial [Clostridia bacterium]